MDTALRFRLAYDRTAKKCEVNSAAIYVGKAESPKEYSQGDQCPDDKSASEAQAHKTLKSAS